MTFCELCPSKLDGSRPMAVVSAFLAPLPGSTIATKMEERKLCHECLAEARRLDNVLGIEVL